MSTKLFSFSRKITCGAGVSPALAAETAAPQKHGRIHATLFCISLVLTILCSCRGPMCNTASMKMGRDGEQAYVVADRSMFQETSGNKILPRIAGMKANKMPAAGTNPGENSEIIQTAYATPMPPIPRDDCPPIGPAGMEQGVPLPYEAYGPWSPAAIKQPWPKDEYLRDGGDLQGPAGVGPEWQVYGVEMEDTIAHYDTVDGRRIVEPSNEVHIYSPRFGAVRQVVGLVSNEQWEGTRGVTKDFALERPTHTQLVGSAKQNIQLHNRIGARPPHAFQTKQGDGAISTAIGPRGFSDGFEPYENLGVIRMGEFDNAEGMLFARSAQAAVAWIDTQSLQVIIDKKGAMEAVKDEKLESVYRVESEGHAKLRLIKVASTPFAKSGEEVWFTLRFDNLGDQVIGNVTIIDSLSTRLEYVAGSAQCSREASFSTQPNEGDSSVLRCEIKDPLEAGQGGVIRFCCKVR